MDFRLAMGAGRTFLITTQNSLNRNLLLLALSLVKYLHTWTQR